jgi:predicted transcriptional regulator
MEDASKGPRRNRNRIQIAADILEIARNGSRKTRIMYLGNLSYELLRKYLDLMVKSQLLELEGRSKQCYVTTKKGRSFLEEFAELQHYSELVAVKKQALDRHLSLS